MSATVDGIAPEVLRLLAAQAGMAAESSTAAAIHYAVRKRLAACGEASDEEYARRLAADPQEFQELLELLVVPETWFFRDAQALRCFVQRFTHGPLRPEGILRVLCVGCSTGEEVYSLAMALCEAGLTPAQFRIVGSDVSRRALDLARRGAFAARSFRERDEATQTTCRRWCEEIGDGWQIRDELRGGVEFLPGNLAQAGFLAGEPPFDAIFCRHVLIYFHDAARWVAVRRLQELLKPDGLLFSAPAEARIFSQAGFGNLGSECPSAFCRPDQTVPCHEPTPRSPRTAPANGPADGLAGGPTNGPAGGGQASGAPRIPSGVGRGSLPDELPSPRSEDVSSRSVLHAAERAADEGRLQDADALCGQLLSQEPASAAAHYLRGLVRQAQGAPDEAQQSLERALYLDPKHYQALVHMMLLAEQRGDQRAVENYRRRAEEVALEKA